MNVEPLPPLKEDFLVTLPKTNTSLAGKSTILMVFTRKHGDFHGRTVCFREGIAKPVLVYLLDTKNSCPFLGGSAI